MLLRRGLVLAAVALAASGCGGRAHPTGDFRGWTRPAARAAHACRALPPRVHLRYPHHVIGDQFYVNTQGKVLRRVMMEFAKAAPENVGAKTATALRKAGFRPTSPPNADAVSGNLWFKKAQFGSLAIHIVPSTGTRAAGTATGHIEFHMPATSFRPAASSKCPAPANSELLESNNR